MMSVKQTSEPEQQRSLRILHAATVCFARIYHQLDVLAPCLLPRRGPAILVCNHLSGLDPALIQSVSRRLIVWMVAREYYEQRGMQWLFKKIEAIPVDRSGRDMSAMRLALRALRNGRVLGIFPEGKLEVTRQLLPFQSGAAMIGLKTGISIYPSYIEGSQRGCSMMQAVLLPQHATITFGSCINLYQGGSGLKETEMAANTIQTAVAALRQSVLARIVGKNQNKITKDQKK
jgi:1-acyl-sn-glycerol-3-phosphate acyltransferase